MAVLSDVHGVLPVLDAVLAVWAGPPHPVTLEVEGFGPVVFCHGTPRDDEEVVLVDSRLERWAEVFEGLPAEVRTVVCGHTHMPFTRLGGSAPGDQPGQHRDAVRTGGWALGLAAQR